MTAKTIIIRGAGITGLWQAYELAQRGHNVSVFERTSKAFEASASWIAGAMLSPFCETESAEPIIRDLGLASLPLWHKAFPGTVANGSLVLAQPRDQRELVRFANLTMGHEKIGREQISALEPALAERYGSALYYPREAHMQPHWAMSTIMQKAIEGGAEFHFGEDYAAHPQKPDFIIDCRKEGFSTR